MERHTAALSKLLGRAVEWRGCTDLALDGRKFSGNAQRRARHSLLFHGTFLLNFDLQLVSQVMPQPSRQPEYRAGRAHGDFLVNLGVSADAVRQSLRAVWSAEEGSLPELQERVAALVREKYGQDAWNLRR
jgi:lipoate---protein ligase